jgi:hypothetical protein
MFFKITILFSSLPYTVELVNTLRASLNDKQMIQWRT